VIGGAWPFLVRGVICLLNCVSLKAPYNFCVVVDPSLYGSCVSSHAITLVSESNERDRNLLLPSRSSERDVLLTRGLLHHTEAFFLHQLEGPLLLSLNQRKVAAITGL